MEKCELIDKCGFFKKFEGTKDLACKGFIIQYCTGPRRDDCKRMQYRKEHGAPPPDEMMPSGQMLKA